MFNFYLIYKITFFIPIIINVNNFNDLLFYYRSEINFSFIRVPLYLIYDDIIDPIIITLLLYL